MMTKHTYEYPRPAFTVDIIALRWRHQRLELLLIKRGREPFQGALAFPGGFVDQGESPRQAAVRECLEETAVLPQPEKLIEIGVFGDPERDPRGWTISAAMIALLPAETEAVAQDDAREVLWLPWRELVMGEYDLAFDHQEMIKAAQEVLRQQSLTTSKLLALLPEPFRTRDVRFLYRQIWGESVSPRAFKAWLRRVALVERVGRALFKPASHLRLPW